MATGVQWIERLMPPVVTGAVVAVIGLNLAPTAVKGVGTGDFNAWIALLTILCVGGVAVYTRGSFRNCLFWLDYRSPILFTRFSPMVSAWERRSIFKKLLMQLGLAYQA